MRPLTTWPSEVDLGVLVVRRVGSDDVLHRGPQGLRVARQIRLEAFPALALAAPALGAVLEEGAQREQDADTDAGCRTQVLCTFKAG